jgi:hypothetical protein
MGNSVYALEDEAPIGAGARTTGCTVEQDAALACRLEPATMRNSVDLPQPDGPRIVMKSLSRTLSVVGVSNAWD